MKHSFFTLLVIFIPLLGFSQCIDTFPHLQSFENGFGTWQNNNFAIKTDAGIAYEGSDYLSVQQGGATLTACVDVLNEDVPQFAFYFYNNTAFHNGSIKVYFSDDNGASWNLTSHLYGLDFTPNNTWEKQQVSLHANKNTTNIKLEAISYSNEDILIDNLELYSVPKTPRIHSGTPNYPNYIELTWADSSDNETGFRIERSAYSPIRYYRQFEEIGTVAANTLSFKDYTAQPRTPYFYRVTAINEKGHSPDNQYNYVEATLDTCYTNFPYIETFENGLTDWREHNNKITPDVWQVHSGTGLNAGTGPSAAKEGSSYLYWNSAMSLDTLSKNPVLVSKCFDLSNMEGDAEMSFWVHMNGNFDSTSPYQDFGLYLELSKNGGNTYPYVHFVGGQGTEWKKITFSLNFFKQSAFKFRLKTHSFLDSISDIAIDSLVIREIEIYEPTNLTATSNAPSHITLNWTDNSNEETAYVIYRSTGTNSTRFTAIDTVMGTSVTTYEDYTAQMNTPYSYMVKATNFSSSRNSNQVSAIMGNCSSTVMNFPYQNSFEVDLGDWRQSTTDDFDWVRTSDSLAGTYATKEAADGDFYLYLPDGNQYKNAILESPCYDITGVDNPYLVFSRYMYGLVGHLQVEATTDYGSNWEVLWSKSSFQGRWEDILLDLSPYKSEHLQLRISGRPTSNTPLGSIAIDNIRIANIPPPPQATNLIATTISHEQIDLSWNIPQAYNGEFIIERSAGDSTNFIEIARVSSATLTYQDTQLSGETDYYYQIQTFDSIPNFSNQANTTVSCLPSLLSESFENGFRNWTQKETTLTTDWIWQTGETPSRNVPAGAFDGNYYVYVEANNNYGKPAVLTSRCFDLVGISEPHLVFNYYQTLNGNSSLEVEVSTDNGANWLPVLWALSTTKNEWQTASIDLTAYENQNIRVRFYAIVGNTYKADIALDKVRIQTITPPNAPVLSLSNLTFQQVGLSWADTYHDEISFTLERSEGTNTNFQPLATLNSGTISFQDNNTVPNTTYFYRLKVTNPFASSDWSNELQVTTPNISCVSDLPYLENFDNGWGYWIPSESTDTTDWQLVPDYVTGEPYVLMTTLPSDVDKKRELELSCVDISSLEDPQLSFNYKLYFKTKELRVEISTDNRASWDTVYINTENQVHDWEYAKIPLEAYKDSLTHIRFVGETINHSSTSYSIVLDNISIFDGPTAPTNLTVSPTYPTHLELNWEDNSSNELGFIIYRSWFSTTNLAQITPIDTVSSNVTSYQDHTAEIDKEYFYQVAAQGVDKHPHSFTNIATNVLQNCLTVTSAGYLESFDNDLGDWRQTIDDEIDWGFDNWSEDGKPPYHGSHYLALRYYSGGTGILYSPCLDISSLTSPSLTFAYYIVDPRAGRLDLEISTDRGLTWTKIWGKGGTQSESWLEASVDLSPYRHLPIMFKLTGLTNHNRTSDLGIDKFVIKNVSATTAPTNLVANLNSSTHKIELSWDDNSSDETHYILERAVGNNSNFEPWATLSANTNSFVDSLIIGNENYFYRVRAEKEAKLSNWSNEASASTACFPLNTTVYAGADSTITQSNFELAADDGGLVGSWTIVTGTANILCETDPHTSIENIGGGLTTLKWESKSPTKRTRAGQAGRFNTFVTTGRTNGQAIVYGNDYLTIKEDFTLETWIKVENSGYTTIIENNSSTRGYSLLMSGNTGQLSWGAGWQRIYSQNALPLNEWVHVVVTIQTTSPVNKLEMYLNGKLEARLESNEIELRDGGYTTSTLLGSSEEDVVVYLDELRFWNTTLQPCEIANWKNQPVSNQHPNYDDLISYFPMDGTLADVKGEIEMLEIVHFENSGVSFYEYGSACPTLSDEINLTRIPHPTQLTAYTRSQTAIELTWKDNTHDEQGYQIERSTNPNAGFSVIAIAPANAISYEDTNVQDKTVYYYRVVAYQSPLTSQYTNIAAGTVLGATFTQQTTGAIVTDEEKISSAAWGDKDGDGDLDLFLTRTNNVSPYTYGTPEYQSNYYQNNGDGSFSKTVWRYDYETRYEKPHQAHWLFVDEDSTLDLGLVTSREDFYRVTTRLDIQKRSTNQENLYKYYSAGADTQASQAWADYDNDGDLDMMLATKGTPNIRTSLIENRGAVFHSWGSARNQPYFDRIGMSAANWVDYDNDGDDDLIITSYEGRNLLYRNEGDGIFTEITSGALVEDMPTSTSYGSSWGDYDNDGDMDVFIPNFEKPNSLFKNNGDGTFSKQPYSILYENEDSTSPSTGSVWADYDNDGDLDLWVINQFADNCLYQNNGEGTFVKVLADFLTNNSESTSISTVDYNQDGNLDVLITNGVTTTGTQNKNVLLKNNGNSSNHWINIHLIGVITNRSAIGSKVFVKTNGNWQMQEVMSNSGKAAQSSLNLEFGLGNATTIEEIRIEWYSGIIQQLQNQAVDTFITIREDINSNLAPAFDSIPPITIYEEDTAYVEITGIDAGERTQQMSFDIEDHDFIANAYVDYTHPNMSGTLVIIPKENKSGTTTVNILGMDGIDTLVRSVELRILPINDPPTFTLLPVHNAIQNAGEQWAEQFATLMDDGDDDLVQEYEFHVVAADTTLFAEQPIITSGGILIYTPKPNVEGTTEVSVTLGG